MLKKLITYIFIISFIFSPSCSEVENKTPEKESPPTVTEDPGDTEPAPLPWLDSLIISPGILSPEFDSGTSLYTLLLESDVTELDLEIEPSPGSSPFINCGEFSTYNLHSIVPVSHTTGDLHISVNNLDGEENLYTVQIKQMSEKFISNSSFEESDELYKPHDWTVTGAGEFRSNNEFSHSGEFSGFFTTLTTSIGGREVLSAPVEIEQGKGCIISAWIYLPVAEGRSIGRVNCSLKIYYYTDPLCENPASPAYSTMSKISPGEEGVWEKIRYERSADKIPPGAEYLRIALRACYNRDNGGTRDDRIYIDDIAVQQ